MITASEPLEFVPHGRIVAANHPGPVSTKGHNVSMSENCLMYKLTNFAIKDDSFLETKEPEHEWWCVREVYCRSSDEFEEEPTTPKESKYDCSESFRPPSCFKTDFNISIKSELVSGLKRMETDCVNSAGTSTGGSANSSSNMSKKFNLSNSKKDNVIKPLSPVTDCSYEEELYVKGCTAIWSRGLISTPGTKLSSPQTRETIACFTIENPIKHAAFCNFHVTINNTMLIDALNSQIGDVKKNIKMEDTTEHIKTKIMPSIILIDNKCLKAFSTDGREYVTSVPFQVKKVWPMKYGVLLEKEASPILQNSVLATSFNRINESHNFSTFSKSKTNFPMNISAKLRAESVSGYDHDVPLPTCFSLSHPLDEVTPILMKTPNMGIQYYNDGDLQIMFVSSNPSIILLYDWKLSTHSLWRIRKATRDECLSMCPNINSTTTMISQTCDFIGSPMHSNVGRNTTSWATGIGSPFQSKKSPTTPIFSKSRQNSPMANILLQQGMSPHCSIGQNSTVSMMANTIAPIPPSLPLYPDICIDHIWTDPQTIRRDPIENASDMKAFLHTDLVGHDYLCFMVRLGGVSRLQIMRLQKGHSHGPSPKTNLIVGSVTSVVAKDAEVLDHLNMIALVDESGNIVLQSGKHFVGKVHIGGVLARLIDSPYIKRHTFLPPQFPRRSSLLPTTRGGDFDDEVLHLLSPVKHESSKDVGLGVVGVRDAIGHKVTLTLDSGSLLRLSLPATAKPPLVKKCSAAVLAMLPRDVAMQVFIKWYGVRNAPGTQDLTFEQEWTMFSNMILSLIGYDMEKLSESKQSDDMIETEVVPKKQRTSSDGTQDDWDYLLNSKLHQTIGNPLATMLNLKHVTADARYGTKRIESEKPIQFNTNALLFPYTVQILYAFHLLYEEIKLNTLLCNELKLLAPFLYQLAKDLKLAGYLNHYWLDSPTDFDLEVEGSESQMTDSILAKLSQPTYFSSEPPNVFSYLNGVLLDMEVGFYPYLPNVNTMSKDLIEVAAIITRNSNAGVQSIPLNVGASSTPRSAGRIDTSGYKGIHVELCNRGITSSHIESLPCGISLLLIWSLSGIRARPPPDCHPNAYSLLWREDLARLEEVKQRISEPSDYMDELAIEILEKETAYTSVSNVPQEEKRQNDDAENSTGMEHLNTKLMSLLFPRDHRLAEVQKLLQSSIPVSIKLTQRPEVSDHDFIDEQEKHLFAVSTRTKALPIARGMLTFRTLPHFAPLPLSPPPLTTSGRGPPPRCSSISLPASEASQTMWPTFHNGAACAVAALNLSNGSLLPVYSSSVQNTTESCAQHAGMLLGLGLSGNLKDMPFMNVYDYLVKCNEMLSCGLLLGLAATYRGTMDVQATKMLSIHLEPLLPPTSVELDMQQNIVCAALLSIGLVYQDTRHAHIASVLLQDIGKPPGPELENCLEREGCALAAGLALGLVCIGAGTEYTYATTLRSYMLPADRLTSGYQKDRYKNTSFAIREGSIVNLDVTAPGATLALGLIYIQTNNKTIASWLDPPATAYDLDFVRPDLLMLRIIARGLILWDSIETTIEWVENQVPSFIKGYCFVKPTKENVDYEAMNQAYCNIISGACFAMALRFAGSGDTEARDTALYFAKLLLRVGNKPLAVLAGRATLDSCLCLCLLSAAMIMSGRGDLEVLRMCRALRTRIPTAGASNALTYGGQMSVHMAIGLLFLGGCRCSLSNSRLSVAALITAFFPKFPTHTEDNRYHLQAFRHLYVLAVEPRLILPRDISTGTLCYAHIQVVDLQGITKEMKAPCIIPSLDTLKEVRIEDPRYWPIVFQRENNWDQLKIFLNYSWCIDIKQRAGCLSYINDPRGYLTILAQTLTLDNSNIWSTKPQNIQLFTNDEQIQSFIKHYLAKDVTKPIICADCLTLPKRKKGKEKDFVGKICECRKYSKEEQEYVQGLSMVTYECVVKDVLCALPVWMTFLKIIKSMRNEPSAYHMWQIKLLLSQIEHHNKRTNSEMKIDGNMQYNDPLIPTEFTLAIKQKISNIFDSLEMKIAPFLRKYLGLPSSRKINTCDDDIKKTLSSFLVYHDLQKNTLKNIIPDSELEVIMCLESKNLSAECINKIVNLLR